MRLVKMMEALQKYPGGKLSVMSEEKLEEIRTNPFYEVQLEHVRKCADYYSGKQLPCIPYSYFKLYSETGSRKEFEKVYGEHRNALGAAAMAALIDNKHISELEDAIWAICDEYSWCLSAHFSYGCTNIPAVLNQAPRRDGKPQPFHREQSQEVDLCAAQTAADLAEIIYLLEDKLAPAVVYRARRLVWERVLQPFMEINIPFDWETVPANWSAVCGGGVGVAAIYMIEDDMMLAPILTRCTQAMECYLSGFASDGVCIEGLNYWYYGFGHFMIYADLLKIRTNGAIDLFDDPVVHTISLFHQNVFLNENNVACFSDCVPTVCYPSGYIHYLHKRYGDVEIPLERFAGSMMPGLGELTYCTLVLRNFIWSSPENRGRQLSDCDSLYNDTQWMICRKTVNARAVAVAVKGGDNNERHNHNDLGSFILDVNGEVLLGDLGIGMYNKKYFGNERYEILVAGSQGHPVPMVNGKTQRAGKDAVADGYIATADTVKTEVYMDIASAYDEPCLEFLQRRITFYKDNQHLCVADTYGFNGELLPVMERLTTQFCPEICGDGTVLVKGKKSSVRISCSCPCDWNITEAEYESNNDPHRKVWLIDAILKISNGGTVAITMEPIEKKKVSGF